MIDRIINALLIPFKVKYIKQIPFVKNWYYKVYYEVYINTGTIMNPIWFNMGSNGEALSLKEIYSTYKLTKKYYEFIKNTPYDPRYRKNYNTVDLHEQLMNEG